MKKSLLALLLVSASMHTGLKAGEWHVAPGGSDQAAGTTAAPFQTLSRARDEARRQHDANPHVVLHAGTFYLDNTLAFTSDDAGTYESAPGEKVVISGGRRLELKWSPYKNGILQAKVPAAPAGKMDFDQLFVNGELQHLARYPNFDPKAPHYNGVAADCLSPQRIKTWAHPQTAIFHALHGSGWGDLHYRVTGVDAKGDAILEGGWQNNRSSHPHKTIRFVENVFEELDAPGEWYLDQASGTLYFYPPPGVDLDKATIEAPVLKHLVEIKGSIDKPAGRISFSHVTFTQAERTFLAPYEPLLRTDWAIYRGGAVLLEGTHDVSFAGCDFVNLGGNALFVNGHNRNAKIAGCKFENIGASAVCFVGLTSAVRSPATWKQGTDWATVEKKPGPANENYPADCAVEDCLIHHIGTVEKQVAGVEIDMAARIAVDHCSIYDCPRAGINIGDGCWGGHRIEHCDVFDTIKETGDHGSFNSWGRDRFWHIKPPAGKTFDDLVKENPTLPEWDAVEPITLANNRWRCDHGWDIDLDDGSSNYHIYNNLCLHGGIKNREGFDRIVENNIMVDNTFHAHVWYKANRGAFQHNIVMEGYKPIGVKDWDGQINHNLFADARDLQTAQQKYQTDADSLAGDPMFIDPGHGDYRVKEGSPALKVGFKNFPMDQFGVVSPRLKAEAATPLLHDGGRGARASDAPAEPSSHAWMGGTVRNVAGLGDRSVFGLPDESGVVIVAVPPGSELARAGLLAGDVIVRLGNQPVKTLDDLTALAGKLKAGAKADLLIIRGQQEKSLVFSKP